MKTEQKTGDDANASGDMSGHIWIDRTGGAAYLEKYGDCAEHVLNMRMPSREEAYDIVRINTGCADSDSVNRVLDKLGFKSRRDERVKTCEGA